MIMHLKLFIKSDFLLKLAKKELCNDTRIQATEENTLLTMSWDIVINSVDVVYTEFASLHRILGQGGSFLLSTKWSHWVKCALLIEAQTKRFYKKNLYNVE